MPIRSLKPEFWTDERMGEVSRDARLLFIGLLNLADDYGVLRGNAKIIKGQVLPFDDVDIGPLLAELESIRRVIRYRPDGEDLLFIVNFTKHQKIDKRNGMKHPLPPGFVVREFESFDRRKKKPTKVYRVVEESEVAADEVLAAATLARATKCPAEKTAEPAETPPVHTVGSGNRDQGKDQGTGNALPPAKTAGVASGRHRTEHPGELQERLKAEFQKHRGAEYRWNFKDELALEHVASEAADEIVRRWSIALRRKKFPQCSSISQLTGEHWNAYATDEPDALGPKAAPDREKPPPLKIRPYAPAAAAGGKSSA